ncbi:MAG TPA: c-type cytochrome [Gammaproteobacteria bacterium]|nr:c-type cytochrome [Gammaproteobacteria bacterium]
MRDHDQQFFDSFMLVLGILIGVTVGLFFLARMISLETQGKFALDDPTVQQQIDERIAPIGRVVLLGAKELAEQQAAAAALPQPSQTKLTGEQVFNMVCYACHAPPGAGGAPVVGDADMWNPRIAKGLPTLEDHALHGFQGEKGFMPPKGGRVDLSDEEIVSAVQFMVSKVQPNAAK